MTLPSAICACCRLRWLVLAWSRVCYTYPTNVFFGRYTPTPLLYAHQHRYTGPTIGPQTIWRSSTRNWYTSGLCRICQLPSNASWLTSSSLNLIQEPKRSVSNLISVSFTVVFFLFFLSDQMQRKVWHSLLLFFTFNIVVDMVFCFPSTVTFRCINWKERETERETKGMNLTCYYFFSFSPLNPIFRSV